MYTATSSFEADSLESLLSPVDKNHFLSAIGRLHSLFDIYARTSPVPLPAPGLLITPEIRIQCECYLPISRIAPVFNRLYSSALSYSPILSSTPFHNSLSWADTFAALPPTFQFSANPARILEALLENRTLLTGFLFSSFLPPRFYGRSGRYPGQFEFIRTWAEGRYFKTMRCLDAACGTGEETYTLALLLAESGYIAEMIHIEGWTLEPLEVWSASVRRFPHDPLREAAFRESTSWIFEQGFQDCIHFRSADVTNPESEKPLDLILCNGLLGGPIIHRKSEMERVVGNLAGLLSTGGLLLAANKFHGGWKRHCPQSELQAVFEHHGLECVAPGEGICGRKR